MSWPPAIFCLYLLLGIELGFKQALSLGGAAPSLVVPLVIFVAIFAAPLHASGFAVIAGLILDLTAPRGMPPIAIPGPNAMALLFAAWATLSLRGTMIRRNPFTLIFLCFAGAVVANLVVTFIYSIRDIYPAGLADPFEWDAAGELMVRLGGALYTTVAGALLTPIFLMLAPLFRFRDHHGHRFSPKS